MTHLSPTALEAAAKAFQSAYHEHADTLEGHEAMLAAAITAYLAQREKEGWVMVPVEATQAMLDAGFYPAVQKRGAKSVWQCMLAAAQNGGK